MSNDRKPTSMMRYAGLASQWMVTLLIAVWGGHKLDEKLWKLPICIILFPLVALILSFWQLINELNKSKK